MSPLTIFFGVSIILLVLPTSTSVDERYETCSSALISRGKNISNVGYPFWGSGRPKYCRHPFLQLNCLQSNIGDQVQLVIDDEKYATYDVFSMKFNQPNIILELRAYESNPCTTISMESNEFFEFTSNDVNVTLVYNCPNDISMGSLDEPVPCVGSPTHNYEAYYLHNKSAINEYASCSTFEFPVLTKQLDMYNQGKLESITKVFQPGFEVNYTYSSECINCTTLGGTCGSSDQSNFSCFYRTSRLHVSAALIFLISCLVPGGEFRVEYF